MKGSNFIFNYISEVHQVWNKTSINHSGSCIDYPKWIKIKNNKRLKKMMATIFSMPNRLYKPKTNQRSFPENNKD